MSIKTIKSEIATAKQAIITAETQSNELEAQLKKRLTINVIKAYADLYEVIEPSGNLALTLNISADDLINEESITRLQMAFIAAGKVFSIITN